MTDFCVVVSRAMREAGMEAFAASGLEIANGQTSEQVLAAVVMIFVEMAAAGHKEQQDTKCRMN